MQRRLFRGLLLCSLLVLGAFHAQSAQSAPGGQPANGAIVASVYRSWHWDIYGMSTDGKLLRRLTFGEGDNRAPAWAPDGLHIAFESNRNNNWDIYVTDTTGSTPRRLTDDPHFDGSPRWSPDGQSLVFTSDRTGDLDIWTMRADGSNPVNLTPSSPAPDYDPVWSPDGKKIAFTSLRDGHKAIWLMDAAGTNPTKLSTVAGVDDEQPAWSPDGKQIAFVSEANGAREICTLDVDAPQHRTRITNLDYDQYPAWAPDGSGLLYVSQTDTEQSLRWAALGHASVPFAGSPLRFRQADWSGVAKLEPDDASLSRSDTPLFVERVTPNAADRPDRYNLVPLNNVRVIVPMLSDTVDNSFAALRQRISAETGWDFLAGLSEAVRPLSFRSDMSDYLSWHKAGRAFDMLFDYFTPQGQMLETAREDMQGQTFWRLYLRTAKQDGSQGEPLREVIWDVTETTRMRLGGRGGLVKGVLPGYYVDLTELLRQYGWERIPSHTEPAFDWHREFKALEYWHYQKTDRLSWWQAIHEIYAPGDIGTQFDYAELVKAKYDISTLIGKGIPVPADVYQKYMTLDP